MRVIGTTPWERDWYRFGLRAYQYRGHSHGLDVTGKPSRPVGFAFPETNRRNEGQAVQRAFDWR